MNRKILIGYMTSSKGSGINKYILNVLKAIGEQAEIDILTSDYNDALAGALEPYNVNIIAVDRLVHPIRRYRQIRQAVREKEYDIAYFNISEAFNCIGNIAVKKNAETVIISHSHASGVDNKSLIRRGISLFMHKASIPIVNYCTDYRYACSGVAGEWLFGKQKVRSRDSFRVVRNTIDVQKFRFDEKCRERIRKENGIRENEKTVGFVGNFVHTKNVIFLIEIFSEIRKLNEKVRFIVIGEGGQKKEMEEAAARLHVRENILFTGRVENVNEYMSAMDVFVLPSRHEGLGIVGLEAQVNGLECFFSTRIPSEIQISKNTHFIELKAGASEWAEQITDKLNCKRKTDSECDIKFVDAKQQEQEFIDIFIHDRFI